jgi:hypothetical protein
MYRSISNNGNPSPGLRLTPTEEKVIIALTGWESPQGQVLACVALEIDDRG